LRVDGWEKPCPLGVLAKGLDIDVSADVATGDAAFADAAGDMLAGGTIVMFGGLEFFEWSGLRRVRHDTAGA
jgi:hypothetical protein